MASPKERMGGNIMHGYSDKTVPVSFRLPAEVHALIEKRIGGKRSRHQTVNQYIKDRVIYDIKRSHKKI